LKLRFRLILFAALIIWFAGIFYECAIGVENSLIIGYPFIHNTYSLVCHQDPDKLINLSCGTTMVCARCTGIYSGLLLNSLITIFFIPGIKTSFKLLFLFTLPMLLDVLFVMLNFYPYMKAAAFITGLLFGSILFLYLYNGLNKLIVEIENR
jgi:uncharacterized membrane protein